MPVFSLETIDLFFICRAIGLLGFAIYVIGFFCLCTGRLDSKTPAYFTLVCVASSCVLTSLIVDFNLSAALIQLFYIVMSLGGIIIRRPKRRQTLARHEQRDYKLENEIAERLNQAT